MTTDEVAALRAEVAELRALVERLTAPPGTTGTPAGPDIASAPTAEPARDRRAFLRGAGLALGGAAAASALTAQPAAAANGDNFVVGSVSNAATASTGLGVTGTTASYGLGVTDNGLAAFGQKAAVSGHAKSAFDAAVYGEAEGERYGVEGYSAGAAGVYGHSDDWVGVAADSWGPRALVAIGHNLGDGVLAQTDSGIALVGESTSGIAVKGTTSGAGAAAATFESTAGIGLNVKGLPAMLVAPQTTAPADRAGYQNRGSLDHGPAGTFWACVEGGTPGTWLKLAGPDTAGQLHVLPSTIRIYDSRAGQAPLGVVKGQLGANQERVIDAKQGGAVPAGATAVLLNVTVVTGSPAGWLAVFKNGIAWPGNSTLNWDHQGQAIANSAVVAVDTLARFKIRAAQATDVIIDAVGYYR